MNTKISILGIGWLGFPLAKKVIEMGFEVKGTTTSESKLEILESNQIQPFQIELLETEIIGNITSFLEQSDVLIINIPPKLRGNAIESFVEKMKLMSAEIEKSTVKKVLFVSSTSVYADAFPIIEINENSVPNPDTESGKQLLEAENLLISNPNFQTIILRFGGLIGSDRHPIKFLAGKTNIANPDAPVNLIHQEDCIGIIVAILKHLHASGHYDKGLRQAQSDKQLRQYQSDIWENNIVFNAVAPQHPSRKEYYQKKAKNLNLPLPIFAENQESKGKIISSTTIEKVLNYSFNQEI